MISATGQHFVSSYELEIVDAAENKPEYKVLPLSVSEVITMNLRMGPYFSPVSHDVGTEGANMSYYSYPISNGVTDDTKRGRSVVAGFVKYEKLFGKPPFSISVSIGNDVDDSHKYIAYPPGRHYRFFDKELPFGEWKPVPSKRMMGALKTGPGSHDLQKKVYYV